MKRWLIYLIGAGALVGGAYYLWGTPGGFEVRSKIFAGRVKDASTVVEERTEEAAEKVQEEAKSIPVKIGETIGSWSERTKLGVRDKIAEIFDQPTSTQTFPAQESSESAGQTAGGSLEVCSLFPVSEKVKYLIKNPFSPDQGFKYNVAWGDGGVTEGEAKESEAEVTLSHLYSTKGAYTVNFLVSSPSGDVAFERRICLD